MPGCIALVAATGVHTWMSSARGRSGIRTTATRRSLPYHLDTKPITAAVVMTLVDDGMLHLDDPVDDLLPELAHRSAAVSMRPRRHRAGQRPITLEDLLTFRMGLGMVFGQTPYESWRRRGRWSSRPWVLPTRLRPLDR